MTDSVSASAPPSQIPSNANEHCVGPQSLDAGKSTSCDGCPNQSECASGLGRQIDPAITEVAVRLADVKHIIMILSGKGGVGKSTVTSQTAYSLSSLGYSVGVLDIDICGPSIPRMMGVENDEVRKSNYGWSPVYVNDNLCVMSIAFMLGTRSDAVIWRGPRKNGLIKQFLTDVDWGKLDFLLIDSPPGTSDEHLSIVNYLSGCTVDGAIIVTTPQEISLLDVRKEINFCKKTDINILGVVENMSGFVCPCCSTKSDIFKGSTGGAAQMCTDMSVKLIGELTLDPNMLYSCENGLCYVDTYPQSTGVPAFNTYIDNLLSSTTKLQQTKQLPINQVTMKHTDENELKRDETTVAK